MDREKNVRETCENALNNENCDIAQIVVLTEIACQLARIADMMEGKKEN